MKNRWCNTSICLRADAVSIRKESDLDQTRAFAAWRQGSSVLEEVCESFPSAPFLLRSFSPGRHRAPWNEASFQCTGGRIPSASLFRSKLFQNQHLKQAQAVLILRSFLLQLEM